MERVLSNFSSVEERRGLLFALGAYLFWGFAPVYFKWVAAVPAHEILAHRIVWSVPVTLLLLFILRQPQQWLSLFSDTRTLGKLMVSATLVSFNWFIFVWAIANNRILDTSLGYFINPLLTIALGVLVLNEKLNRLKFLALLCAAAGVAWQVMVIGGVPWVSLGLAVSFALYGLMRKQIVVKTNISIDPHQRPISMNALAMYRFIQTFRNNTPLHRHIICAHPRYR